MDKIQQVFGIGGLVLSMMGCDSSETDYETQTQTNTASVQEQERPREWKEPSFTYQDVKESYYVIRIVGNDVDSTLTYEAIHPQTGRRIQGGPVVRSLGWFKRLEDRNGDGLGDIVLNFQYHVEDVADFLAPMRGERTLFNTGKQDADGRQMFRYVD